MRPQIIVALALILAPMTAVAAGLTVPVDQSRRIPIGGAAASIVVGNTAIADVRAIDTRTLMVVGKRPGVTNVVVLDASGRTLFDAEVVVSASAGSMVTVFSGLQSVEFACAPYCQADAPTGSPALAPVVTTPAPVPTPMPSSGSQSVTSPSAD